jgi:hypothetical protein
MKRLFVRARVWGCHRLTHGRHRPVPLRADVWIGNLLTQRTVRFCERCGLALEVLGR